MKRQYPEDFSLEDEWSSLICALVFSDITYREDGAQNPQQFLGYIMVIEWGKRNPLWKLAGGHKDEKVPETPQQTAQREFQGETGIRQPVEDFILVPKGCKWRDLPKTEWSGPHWSLLFETRLTLSQVKMINNQDTGNEYETCVYFPKEEFWMLYDRSLILPLHEQRLVETALILPEFRSK